MEYDAKIEQLEQEPKADRNARETEFGNPLEFPKSPVDSRIPKLQEN
jgi:hypothetical protein